jgi:hypothetical protein
LRGARFAQILLDDEPLAYWVQKDKELTDDVVLSATKRAVEASVEPETAGVRVVFGPDGLALRCPDLRTAMYWVYWAFAGLVAGKRASALCEYCGKVSEKTNHAHRICSSTCRSN